MLWQYVPMYVMLIKQFELNWIELRERDAEQGDTRNSIKNRGFRTLILKLVNPESGFIYE